MTEREARSGGAQGPRPRPPATGTVPFWRSAPFLAVVVLVAGTLVARLRLGMPATVLWWAFAALAGAILLFFESLRAVLDPDAPGDESAADARGESYREASGGASSDLEERKRAALRGLKDLEFEHSIRRISDEDYAVLRDRYRAEARAAMEAMDRDLGAYLAQAETLIARAGAGDDTADEGDVAATKDGAAGKKAARRGRKGAAAGTPVATSEPAGEPVAAAEPAAATTAATAATSAAVESAAPVPAASTSERAVCASCETSNEPDATFCKRCGAKLGSG